MMGDGFWWFYIGFEFGQGSFYWFTFQMDTIGRVKFKVSTLGQNKIEN